MIFVTLGSQKFQFNRLLIELDKLVENNILKEEIFAQIGYSNYLPKNYKYKQFLNREEFADKMSKSTIVITHGGTGAIIGAVKKGKKVIAVPRLAKYGEHVDDHQLQLINQFSEMELIVPCHEINNLFDAYLKVNDRESIEYKSNTKNYIEDIDNFLNE